MPIADTMLTEIIAPVCVSLLLLWVLVWRAWRIFRPKTSWLDHPAVYFGLVFVAMLALRWHSIQWNAQLNADETQMLAQSMRFMSHPVPWRDVDGTTGGPLNSLLLCVPLECGAPATWQMSRLVQLVSNCAVIGIIYLTLRFALSRAEAQFATLPVIFFYAFVRDRDFTHYASETLSSILLSACFYLIAKTWSEGRPAKLRLFIMGLLLGAAPFCKLQTAPLVALLAVVALALSFSQRRGAGKGARVVLLDGACLVSGAVLIPALILGIVAAHGALGDFWKSYILASKKYALEESVVKRIRHVAYVLLQPIEFFMFFLSGVMAAAVLLGTWRSTQSRPGRKVLQAFGVVCIYGALTLLCFAATGKAFNHYVFLLVPALALFIGLVFFAVKGATPTLPANGAKFFGGGNRWLVAFAVFVVGLQAYKAPMRTVQCIGKDRLILPPKEPALVTTVRVMSHPGDTLSVWGWAPEFYVRTALPPATRDAVGHYVVSAGPYENYYRERYLRDLKAAKPAFFVDAVGDGVFLCWYQWTATNKHECFPELTGYINQNYALVSSFQMKEPVKVGTVRLYVLKDRLQELHRHPAAADAAPILDYQ